MGSDMTINIDNMGRIIIPEAFVNALGLKEKDNVYISLDNFRQKITVGRAVPACAFCCCAVDLIQISNKFVCVRCRDRLASAAVGDCLY